MFSAKRTIVLRQCEGLVYRSERLTISEICGSTPQADAGVRALVDGTLVFVRSGLFGACNAQASIIFDANYVVLGCDGEYLYPVRTSKEPYNCTVLCFTDPLDVETPALANRCVLSSPQAHLNQARLLIDARLRRIGGAIEDAAFALLREAAANAQSVGTSTHEHLYTVQAIKELLNRAFSKPPPLAEVARQFYLSPFTVSHMFHRETGISLRRYACRLRLRKALYLMLSGFAALTDIADELGFYDESHFSKAFSAEFGIPPAVILKTTTWSNTPLNPISAVPSTQD